MTDFVPTYLKLPEGELAQLRMSKRDLCPRRCNVDRLAGELGVCRSQAGDKCHPGRLHSS